jgi:hypothetical protein
MNKRPRDFQIDSTAKPLTTGKLLRIGVRRNGKQAAGIWKFWSQGADVYAMKRQGGNTSKISVHATGQIHMRTGTRDLQHLAPAIVMADGLWHHAFELRFLLSKDTYSPPAEILKKNDNAFLLDVPEGAMAIFQLFIGKDRFTSREDLPKEILPNAFSVWRTTLSDFRPVLLALRLLEMDAKNREEIELIRHQVNPRVTLRPGSGQSESHVRATSYAEFQSVHWSTEGGNVVLVVPMGAEAFRVRDEPIVEAGAVIDEASHEVVVTSARGEIPVVAPNGVIVGTITFVDSVRTVRILKGTIVRSEICAVVLKLKPENLLAGERFETRTNFCSCVLSVDGAPANNWGYRVRFIFDGSALEAEISASSAAIRSESMTTSLLWLKETEELALSAPVENLVIAATISMPETTVSLIGSFILRDNQ